MEDGAFLVRPRELHAGSEASSFILSVRYKQQPTHHLLTPRDSDSLWLVNNKLLGPGTVNLLEVCRGLGVSRVTWWLSYLSLLSCS